MTSNRIKYGQNESTVLVRLPYSVRSTNILHANKSFLNTVNTYFTKLLFHHENICLNVHLMVFSNPIYLILSLI